MFDRDHPLRAVFARDRLIRRTLRERFVVTMKSGATFEGLLAEVDDRTVVLVNASALDENGRHRVDGSLYLPRSEVDYLQRPGD